MEVNQTYRLCPKSADTNLIENDVLSGICFLRVKESAVVFLSSFLYP